MKPDLKHYPVWLREMIFPDFNMRGYQTQQDTMENHRALRQIFDNGRDPICRILSCLVLWSIRRRFKDYAARVAYQERYVALEARVLALEAEVITLRRKKKGK